MMTWRRGQAEPGDDAEPEEAQPHHLADTAQEAARRQRQRRLAR